MKDKSTILNKKEEPENKLENFLIRIAPYLIFFMFFILIFLVLMFMMKNGSSITGTEANRYYYHLDGSKSIISFWRLNIWKILITG